MAKKRTGTENDIRTRHTTRQRRRRNTIRARRMFLVFILILVLIGSVMFLTPLFNIQNVKILGNEKVSTEQIQTVTSGLYAQNLFRINIKQVQSSLQSFSYLKTIKINRILYPPGLKVTVSEASPVAMVAANGAYALLDDGGKVLEIVADKPARILEVTGVNASSCTVGSKLAIDETSKFDIILLCIQEFVGAEILDKVSILSVADENMVTFTYDNRLEVICGSTNDLSKKTALFKEAVMSNRMAANARGTMDLSTTGKAIYTP